MNTTKSKAPLHPRPERRGFTGFLGKTKMNELNEHFKKNKILVTNVGNFEFIKQIGNGGNSYVFLFKKNNFEFAIKFLTYSDDDKKINRFKDEYFCSIQIPSHENIVQQYHLDKVAINEKEYFFIIMKKYESTLKPNSKRRENSEFIL